MLLQRHNSFFFHVQHWNRIPFDSEIDFFLQYCLGITLNQQLPKHYHFLVERIYNSCVNLFHSLSFKRDSIPGKNCSWQKKNYQPKTKIYLANLLPTSNHYQKCTNPKRFNDSIVTLPNQLIVVIMDEQQTMK